MLRTLAAFLNTEGGTLLIGVEDSGEIYGLERDLSLLDRSLDRFQQLMASLILEHLGAVVSPLIKVRFEDVEGKKVCVIGVDKASEPVFLKGERGKEFFVRVGPTTRTLDPEQTVDYITSHWSS